MSGFSSKFRHIWGDAAKAKDSYGDIKNALTSGESQYVKANSKFLAYGKASGGAPVYVRKFTDKGRTGPGAKNIATHKGRLTDFDFHPFIETLIATAGDDCKVNINKFPAEGLTENVTKAEVELKGHKKKLSLVLFNPSANNIIASASYDRTVKIFNVENASCVQTYDQYKDNIYSMAWNKDGSMLATTSKDKCLRIMDPRKPDDAITVTGAFGGIKATKCFYVNAFGWVGSTGFSKSAKRELKIWDPRNIEKPIYAVGLDNQASVLIPNVDNDLNILYLAGKGDNSVSYYELRNDDKIAHYLSLYRDSTPQKGGGWVYKRGLNVMKCEVQRFLKLTKDSIIPISFIVPRKSGGDVFQDDIYPPCASAKPAKTADEWIAGESADPCTMSMDPDDRKDEDGGEELELKTKPTYEQLELKIKKLEEQIKSGGGVDESKLKEKDDEIAKLNAKVAALEKQLAEAQQAGGNDGNEDNYDANENVANNEDNKQQGQGGD